MSEWMRLIEYGYLSLLESLLGKTEHIFFEGSEGKFHIRIKAYTVAKRNWLCDIIWKFSRRVAGQVYASNTICWLKFYILIKTLCLVKITLQLGDNTWIYFKCKYFCGKRLPDSFHMPRDWKVLPQLTKFAEGRMAWYLQMESTWVDLAWTLSGGL